MVLGSFEGFPYETLVVINQGGRPLQGPLPPLTTETGSISMAIIVLPEADYLRQVLEYDPISGTLRWKFRPRSMFSANNQFLTWNKRFSGKIAGSIKKDKLHVTVRLNGCNIYAHRIVWKIVTGDEPPDVIDHENRDGLSNLWGNLRKATKSQNNTNAKIRKDSKSGVKGAYGPDEYGGFRSGIQTKGRRIYLGYFDTAAEAHAAYCKAARELHGEFWNPG
jgi:hypothetical protein